MEKESGGGEQTNTKKERLAKNCRTKRCEEVTGRIRTKKRVERNESSWKQPKALSACLLLLLRAHLPFSRFRRGILELFLRIDSGSEQSNHGNAFPLSKPAST
ncbi:hypothetical protein Csa_003878 [Cucumis sativus]|uniref:Uncharacterized protein n=1 Tax=Cucumis sativus TaxID=3659 RepID=A0A0A0KL05_CUCSA|nr:hypothetical protein Csa_003878 [Cucumis sativus]